MSMKTIRAIFRDGMLKPLDPVDLPENTQVTVALFESDDLPADAIGQLAREGGVQFPQRPPGRDLRRI
jgi:predicted DNA-binding antitoxin AbrB/MazE fold protein